MDETVYRRKRRASRAKAGRHPIDPVTALHEAGHAVGRYLTALEMGLSEDEVITEIVVETEGRRPEMGTSFDGRMKLVSLAVCNGPMLSAELQRLVPAAMEIMGIAAGSTLSGRQALDLVKEVLAVGRSEGIDVDAWVGARAVVAVFGPMVEAGVREVPFQDVWDGYEAEDDVTGIVGDGVAAGLSSDEIGAVIETAKHRVLDYLQEPKVGNAVNALGNHLLEHGTTAGERAAAIIRDAMKAS